MPYRFNFDLTKVPRYFFKELARIAHQKQVHKKMGKTSKKLLDKFRLQEITGLNLSDALTLLEDFVDIQVRNMVFKEKFDKTRKRALLLPHCARKYMDSRCKASFDPEIPSYYCQHCSEDCLIHKATLLGEERNYDVYILPGGSCITKILQKGKYDGVVGVACGEEIKLGLKILEEFNVVGQAVPLIKNGCANTSFNLESLAKVL